MEVLEHQQLIYLCLVALTGTVSSSGSWDYGHHNGPDTWAASYPQFCSGSKQSPIDLRVTESKLDSLIKKFVSSANFSGSTATLTLGNNGHALNLTWSGVEFKIGLSTDMLMYTAEQLHWHWGSDKTKGSEHTVNGAMYPAEAHFVFYNSRDYTSFSAAANRPNGLAVLSTFYELSEHDNALFSLLANAMKNDSLQTPDSTIQITVEKASFDLFKLLLPTNTDEFYRYDGSLTTPNCYESVLWTVYRQTVSISERQLNLLRRLQFSDNTTMQNNYRPPLMLNPEGRPGTPRTLYRTFGSSAGSLLPGLQLMAAMVTVAMVTRLLAGVPIA